MKVIDANTGTVLREGETFANVNGTFRVEKIEPGLRRAFVVLDIVHLDDPIMTGGPVSLVGCFSPPGVVLQPGQRIRCEVLVRWLHPNFMLQHVAFLPS